MAPHEDEGYHGAMTKPLTEEGSVGTFRTEFVDLPHPLVLASGRELSSVRIAYETYGTLSSARDNVILVCHALSGDAHAAGWSAEPAGESALDGFGADERGIAKKSGLGWWDGMIGPGKAFDTDRYFVVSTNVIGGCRGSTGPLSPNPLTGRPYGLDFPVITVADMVRAERALLTEIGIDEILGVSGGSLGGMQALEWAYLYPDKVRSIVPIASTSALDPQGVALNAVARNAIMGDPDWQNGHYYGTGRAPNAGMAVARMVGHVTYLSAHSMAEKFGRRLQTGDDITYSVTGADFEIESYLRHQGEKFVRRFDANTYLYLSRALSYFDLARQYGDGSLEEAVARFEAATLLICFSSDWLYPPENSRRIARALEAQGKRVELHVIEAPYGHDSFLLEEGRQTPMIRDFLARVHDDARRARRRSLR
jgi:homoserine O-acetyltransferase/O-succinyltransferase